MPDNQDPSHEPDHIDSLKASYLLSLGDADMHPVLSFDEQEAVALSVALIEVNSREKASAPVGFVNGRNQCWMISLLAVLLQLREVLTVLSTTNACLEESLRSRNAWNALRRLLSAYLHAQKTGGPVGADVFDQLLASVSWKDIKGGIAMGAMFAQQDAAEGYFFSEGWWLSMPRV